MLDVAQPRPRPLSRWNSLFFFAFTLVLILLPVLLLCRQHVTAITQVWQRVQAQGPTAFAPTSARSPSRRRP